MNYEVIVTCAVTGSADTAGRHPDLPITPKQIAQAAIDAARAGAAVAHIHVRDPKTGAAAREVNLYAEVVDRVRDSDVDVVLNLTAGMGGDLVLGKKDLHKPGVGTDMVGAEERLAHVEKLRPEICSLDCGSLNFGDDFIYISTPPILRKMASLVQEWGVKPELEVFELGHLRFAKQMLADGLIDAPPLFQICLGIPWGADHSVSTMQAMRAELPADANWGGFGIARMQMPMAAVSVAMGGNVRVGLEDNLYLDKGVLASNAQLVERVIEIIERLGARAVTPAEARKKLALRGG